MSNEVEIVVTGDNRAKPALDSARQGVKGLGDDAKTSSKASDVLGAALKDVGDKATATLSRSTVGFRSLTSEIDKTKKSIVDLKAKFGETGHLGLLGDIDKDEAKLRKLEGQLKKTFDLVDHQSTKKKGGLLDFALDDWLAKTGKAAAGAIASGLESGVQSAGKWASSNPWMAAGIAAGIALGAPAIGGAVTAAIGGGVIAGGIVLAAQDPRVGEAWRTLGAAAKGKLTGAADVFIDPLIHGAKTFGDTLDRILPNISHDFTSLAPVADKLFSGAAGFVEKLMPGIDALSTQAGPTLTMVAAELPRMGAAISQMMEAIASGGEGGKQALHDLLVLTEAVTVSTGNSIAGFEKWYQAERSLVQLLAGDFDGARRNWENLIYGIDDASRMSVKPAVMKTWETVTSVIGAAGNAAITTDAQFKQLAEAAGKSLASVEDLAKGAWTDKMLSSLMSMDQATLGFAESQTRLSTAIDENGRQLDIHTARGQANREAILGVVQANIGEYDAMIRAGAGADEASKAYDTNTQALEAQLQKAGFTQAAIDGLIGKYRGVPAKVNTEIAMQGLTSAIQSLDDAIRLANHLDGRTVNTYLVNHVATYYENGTPQMGHSRYGPNGDAHGGIIGAAGGGPRSNLTWVGEQGRELVRLPFGSTVYPHGQSERMAAGIGDVEAGGGGGGGGGYASADAIGEAVARRIVPALMELAGLANRPAVLQANGVELARTVREGERSLVRQG